jgi:hypothetical protein
MDKKIKEMTKAVNKLKRIGPYPNVPWGKDTPQHKIITLWLDEILPRLIKKNGD